MMADMTSLLQTKEVGLAVRPTVALLNHSCCPNTVRASAGSQVKDTFKGYLNYPLPAQPTDQDQECYFFVLSIWL